MQTSFARDLNRGTAPRPMALPRLFGASDLAIYHLSVKTVSRGQGRSGTAAAAYRAGTTIADERTGEVHAYSRKSGVAHSEIILPDGADPKFQDRSTLWNEVEKSETRKNSTVAREYEVALPAELSPDQRKELAIDYGQWLSERFGVGVDVSIHEPHREGDQRNHHAHILTTTRKIEGAELTTKTRELDDKKSGAILEVREKWAELSNQHLDQANELARIDHRSHRERGIEQIPTVHNGPAATVMERRGQQSERGTINRLIEAVNRQFSAAKSYFSEVAQTLARRDKIEAELERRRQERQGHGQRQEREGTSLSKIEAELARRKALRAQEQAQKPAQEQQKAKIKPRSVGRGLGMEM